MSFLNLLLVQNPKHGAKRNTLAGKALKIVFKPHHLLFIVHFLT